MTCVICLGVCVERDAPSPEQMSRSTYHPRSPLKLRRSGGRPFCLPCRPRTRNETVSFCTQHAPSTSRTSRLPYGPGRFSSGHGALWTSVVRISVRLWIVYVSGSRASRYYKHTRRRRRPHTAPCRRHTRSDVVILISFSRFSPSTRRKRTHFFRVYYFIYFTSFFSLYSFVPCPVVRRARYVFAHAPMRFRAFPGPGDAPGCAGNQNGRADDGARRSTHKLTHTPPGRCFAFV